MHSQTNPTNADNPANAFEALRSEVSLLRRAVEGLTAERQNLPDYTPTLKEIANRLMHIDEFVGTVAESPAMRLTPQNLAASIATASETARAGDRETIGKARDTISTSIAGINNLVEQAWTADRQWRQLYWTGAVAFVLGALFILALSRLTGDPPQSRPAPIRPHPSASA